MNVAAMRHIMKSLLGQISGYTSPYPTVENVTMTNQRESNKSKYRAPPLCRCCIPQTLKIIIKKQVGKLQYVLFVLFSMLARIYGNVFLVVANYHITGTLLQHILLLSVYFPFRMYLFTGAFTDVHIVSSSLNYFYEGQHSYLALVLLGLYCTCCFL